MIASVLLLALLQGVPQPRTQAITVGSKPFAESYVLGEMFAQLLEARGFRVDRRLGLGATEVAFAALQGGLIDVYPEYTGTAYLTILRENRERNPHVVFGRVAAVFPQRFGVYWLPPLGFENTYAIAVRPEIATRYQLRTLSDLARAAPELTAGLSPDFVGRADGLPGLEAEYGLRFRQVRPLLQPLKYTALTNGEVDVIDGYSTDGLIDRNKLVVLTDDRHFFPPYEAAALVSTKMHQNFPAAVAALTELSGRIDQQLMSRLNERVEGGNELPEQVAASALRDLGLLDEPGSDAATTDLSSGSLIRYFALRRQVLATLIGQHLLLVLISLGAAILIAVPIGLGLERAGRAAEPIIRVFGILQTIPGIALLAFMIPLIGIGPIPALVALFLYSLYPILRNTYTGVRDAAPDVVESARASGMTPGQVLRYVRLPLASPFIMAGVRTAAVIGVGTATLAAFIGAGGLGDPIVSGLALSDSRMILFGAIPAAALALVIDIVLGTVERVITRRFASS